MQASTIASRALKSRFELRVALGLRSALETFVIT